jgi:starvation-inducible DNA-binding protein
MQSNVGRIRMRRTIPPGRATIPLEDHLTMATTTRVGTRDTADGTRLFRTKNDLPAATRADVVKLFNQRLADCIDLKTMCKQAHWNVKGAQFIALHKLFDEVNGAVEEYVDLIAERITQLGGVAEGTARAVAERTALDEYPLILSRGEDHVAALSSALAQFGRTARIGIEEMNELEDADSADILTEISRGIDKWLWFVEAHGQGEPAPQE